MSGRRILVGLILTATAAFVVGVILERDESHSEAAEAPARRAAESPAQRAGEGATSGTISERGESRESAQHSASGEGGERGSENAEHGESGESAAHDQTSQSSATTTGAAPTTETPQHSEASEKLLGVNPESTGLLVIAVVASLLLAAGVWWLGASPLVSGVVAVAMAAFGALDVREVVHQARESRTGLMLLAALVAVLHLVAAAIAARAAVAARDTGSPTTSADAAA
jgi:hypothetical protein